jgi:hypothetical protein
VSDIGFLNFIARWRPSSGSERANKDSYLNELCDALEVERPSPTTGDLERDTYVFERDAEPRALPLDKKQLETLLAAARCRWENVEPAIFGTLLERALDPRERHRLGAHYTPRAYVERLVRPTIEELLREDWELVQVEARRLEREGRSSGDDSRRARSEAALRATLAGSATAAGRADGRPRVGNGAPRLAKVPSDSSLVRAEMSRRGLGLRPGRWERARLKVE